MGEKLLKKAKDEAKTRKRAGHAAKHTAALKQLAAENGYEDWATYARVLAAQPDPAPQLRVRLISPNGEAREATSTLRQVLTFHDLDEQQWCEATPEERVSLVLECALSMRRTKGDMTPYTALLVESNIPSVVVHGQSVARPNDHVPGALGEPDFVVVLESRESGRKEAVGVQLADLLEFHGIDHAEWESSAQDEQVLLVEEVALWGKRSAGDLTSYFSEVVTGLGREGEFGTVPR
ncbi:hypothetical protein ACWV27_25585 (plasmid) [Massilia varians]